MAATISPYRRHEEENLADPSVGNIRLAVAIIRATGNNRQPDPIIYLAGGPGSGVVATAPSLAVRMAQNTGFAAHELGSQTVCDAATRLSGNEPRNGSFTTVARRFILLARVEVSKLAFETTPVDAGT